MRHIDIAKSFEGNHTSIGITDNVQLIEHFKVVRCVEPGL